MPFFHFQAACTMSTPQQRIRTLVQTLNRYAHEYYTLDAPTVPDSEYDRLYRELEALEAQYPAFRLPVNGLPAADSPTMVKRLCAGVAWASA